MAKYSISELKISPFAWAKIQWFFKEVKPEEVSGFGITTEEDLLMVVDFQTILQTVTTQTVDFDDVAMAKFVGENASKGIDPVRCFRVWIHSHPFSDNPSPSPKDYDNVEGKLLGLENEGTAGADWAVMVIVGKGGSVYSKLFTKIKAPGKVKVVEVPLKVVVDWQTPIWEHHKDDWEKEKEKNIKLPPPPKVTKVTTALATSAENWPIHNNSSRTYAEAKGRADNSRYLASPAYYRKHWPALWSKWKGSSSELCIQDYAFASSMGFTSQEIETYGVLTLEFTPKELRAANLFREDDVMDNRKNKKGRRRKKDKNGNRVLRLHSSP